MLSSLDKKSLRGKFDLVWTCADEGQEPYWAKDVEKYQGGGEDLLGVR